MIGQSLFAGFRGQIRHNYLNLNLKTEILERPENHIHDGSTCVCVCVCVCVNCVPQCEFGCLCTAVFVNVRVCACVRITSLSCPNNNHVSSKTSRSHCREIGLVHTH